MSDIKKTVLLIDSDSIGRAELGQWLGDLGWDVLEADNGDAGLALAVEREPDVIFCDVLAPGCNGFQICRSLRSQSNGGLASRIILTTVSDYDVHRETAAHAGADDYLVKPISYPEFLRFFQQFTHNGSTTEFIRASAARRPSNSVNEGAVRALAQRIPNGELRTRFWGVRGSVPTPGRATLEYGGNTSCVEVRGDGQLIILDAGTGIREAGLRLAEEFQGLPLSLTLLISHTHWDHIQGLPFFSPAYNPLNRLRIIGCEGAREGLLATLSSQMESPYFPIGWRQLPSHITIDEVREPTFSLGSIEVQTIFLNHPGLCLGYRINSSGGSVAYLPDNEPFQRYKYHTSKTGVSGSTEFLQLARRMDQKLEHFVRGVDVLIMDSQYDATEYQTRVGWGHGCVEDVVALALNAEVKRLFLFHHDPSHNDAKISQMVDWGRSFVKALGENLEVDGAREGLEVCLTAHPQEHLATAAA